MFLSNSGSKHISHGQYGLMDMNMINNKFASQAIHKMEYSVILKEVKQFFRELVVFVNDYFVCSLVY